MVTISPPKFKQKYRIASSRLKEWDYGAPGYYFVTICTQNRVHWFGEISQGRRTFSPEGEIAGQYWENIPHIYPNICLDAWVVMPNHIHAIVIITGTPGIETFQWNVSTKTRYLRSGTLGVIINQYKSACTKYIHKIGNLDFGWQARFYDHIIRNERSLERIRDYILENPIKWAEDEYFSES